MGRMVLVKKNRQNSLPAPEVFQITLNVASATF